MIGNLATSRINHKPRLLNEIIWGYEHCLLHHRVAADNQGKDPVTILNPFNTLHRFSRAGARRRHAPRTRAWRFSFQGRSARLTRLLAARTLALLSLLPLAAHAADRPYIVANSGAAEEDEEQVWSVENWVRQAGVELRGAGTDESPHCYKRLDEVLQYHQDTVRILHTLTPIGVAMAGSDEYDPYKD